MNTVGLIVIIVGVIVYNIYMNSDYKKNEDVRKDREDQKRRLGF